MLKKFVPKFLRNAIHYFFAWYGAVKYKHPSDELFVIGITGTSGKSSTVYWLRQVLESAGYRVGSLSTIDFYIAGENRLNDQKMTMLGRTQIQKYLREMVRRKCDIAIVEMTSEGAVQHRNKFINVDTMALTNLYPEHIESHGSFEKYKDAKRSMFAYVAQSKRKSAKNVILSQQAKDHLANANRTGDPSTSLGSAQGDEYIPKTAIINGNNKHADEFLQFPFEKKIAFSSVGEEIWSTIHDEMFEGEQMHIGKDGLSFQVADEQFRAHIFGAHNIANLTVVITIARSLGIPWEQIVKAVNAITGAPGRVEFIPEAEKRGFQVIVDYAFEPVALQGLYRVVDVLQPARVIHVCGSAGGGRDASRREVIGRLAGELADIVIVTDEDPYDENPIDIIHAVSQGAQRAGKMLNQNVFEILDRREAIQKALTLAQPGDLVLITGKGSEQAMCVSHGKKIAWDDRKIVRRLLV